MRFFCIFIALTAFFATAIPAIAADKVAVRSGAHEEYTRLVFEWPSRTDYSISKDGARVLIRFGKAGEADLSGVASEKNIVSLKTVSGAGEPLQVAVEIPSASRFRDFTVSNKTIIDIYNPEGAGNKSVAEKSQQEAKISPAKMEKSKPLKEENATKEDFSITPAHSEQAAPISDVEAAKVPPPMLEPHVITLTGTSNISLAVFERGPWLWLVMDTKDASVPPIVSGPQKDKLPPLVKVDVPQGVAYRMDIPEGMKVYADGGGLSWRIVLGTKDSAAKAMSVARDDGPSGMRIVWPLQNMRKIIKIADPIIGDQIIAITALDASQFAGAPRDFVDLTTMKSIVGLAYVAKTDDLDAKIDLQKVSVGRQGGLKLSSSKDIAPDTIRQEVNDKAEEKPEDSAVVEEAKPKEQPLKEEEKAEHAIEAAPTEEKSTQASNESTNKPDEAKDDHAANHTSEEQKSSPTTEELSSTINEKPSGNNIYNFPRWEMGGVKALEQNQHVMMVELSGKKKQEQNEDLITLAKIFLANDRAQEALGLFRIALQNVPELEDNIEFEALRGAAMTLSGKYDEAILDFSRAGLKDYEDIKYWRAYTLAGLEDWKQAIAVLPKTLGPIAQYPIAVKTPLVLAFAEIALRAGNAPQAMEILNTLKSDLPKMPLNDASAWKYLAGETARQKGDSKLAVEYWEPLVKNGKDDLYRAKAGLSLTKLQLDLKQIKPADAINRLEGLRYAWRGDELETLINYRLGQMYIDDKDYLKGLTVLRNASTLSPGSELAQNVSAYMTKSFRDVFANDRLNAMSPLEAISLYQEFKDILPPGEESDKYAEQLAERLVNADLLGRAASLLEYQVNNRLKGNKKAEIAIRLAAIRLLDGNPDGALRSLEVAQDTLDKMAAGAETGPGQPAKPEEVKPEAGDTTGKPEEKVAVKETVDPEKQRQILLLKARALSMKKKTDEAMALLETMHLDPDVNRLRTDIAWSAGRWEEAAIALNDLIVAEDISPKRPLTDYQRDIIFNRSIALNLSGNRVALSNLRERYNAQMKNTSKGAMFEIVTRPRRPDMIGSREAISSMISEIDLFKGFVDGYSKMDAKPEAKEPAAPKEAVPAGDKSAEDKKTTAEQPVAEEKKP